MIKESLVQQAGVDPIEDAKLRGYYLALTDVLNIQEFVEEQDADTSLSSFNS